MEPSDMNTFSQLLHSLLGIGIEPKDLTLLQVSTHGFGILIKGKPAVLVQNGRLQRKSMLWNHISEHDLEEDMRLEARTEDLSEIKVARVERSGEISFVKAE
jgi:uncharacterized membrane protein YcaP (DUF421 family)